MRLKLSISAFSLRTFLILLVLQFSLFANAQTYYFDKYDVRDGLAQSKVYSAVQDQSGFLWLGTTIGASRFDGINFVNYSTDDGLSENGVKNIFIDSKKQIWMGHIGGGITRYNGKKFEKIEFKNLTHDITSLVEDADGRIWISSVGDGVIRIDNPQEPDVSKLTHSQLKGKETLSDFVFAIYKRKNNTLFFITDLGLKTFSSKDNKFEFIKPNPLPTYFQLTCMYEDVQDNLWFGTYNGGLYKYNEKKGEFKIFDMAKHGLASNWISTITGDKLGNLWVGTWGEGISVIKDDKLIENFHEKNGLNGVKIWDIIQDREGNIVIGTNENGFYIYKGKRFISYTKSDGLINDQVWAISQDGKQRYWFGTNDGLTIFTAKDKSYQSFSPSNSNLVSKQIRYLVSDKKGGMWIGTNDYGVQYFDINSNSFYYDGAINGALPASGLISALEVDKQNNLWVGTTDWLLHYNSSNKTVKTYSKGDGLVGNDISAIFCDKNGVIWVGSRREGLSRIVNGKITAIPLNEHFTTKCMMNDLEGNLWVGTEDRGIFVLKDGIIVKRYKTKQGLLSNNILALNLDQDGNVFVGTSVGLNKINVKNDQFYVFTEKSGFTGLEVKDHATFKDKEGNLWFGTTKGAIKYTKAFDIPNLTEPQTYINKFLVNLQDRAMDPGLKLDHRDQSITFDFGSICLSDAQGIKYLYKLKGSDKDWIRPENNIHTVTYSPLPHGTYTFQLKASNNEGIWNEVPISYTFTIKPPFWKTWWFYSILVLSVLLLVGLYIKIRERNLQKEKRILEEKVMVRTQEAVAEKEKSEGLLLNTLPSKVVEDLKKFGKVEPESYDNVTIFFSDIITFTDISANLDPKVTINELNDMFTAFDDIMIKHNCERIKTFGDGYMSVCGLPEANPDHAINIARASLEIIQYMKNKPSVEGLNWEVRIGINTGKVTGGIVGVRKYLYDIFGDSVNTASRMESNSEAMRINCSEATYQILKDKMRFTKRGLMPVKGKGEMKMYFLEGELVEA